MCSVDLNMGTISGTTHIKTIVSFWPDIDILFVTHSAALLSRNSFTFCTFHDSLLQNPWGRTLGGVKSAERKDQAMFPHLLSGGLEISCPERHEHNWWNGMVHHLTGTLFREGQHSQKCQQSPWFFIKACHTLPFSESGSCSVMLRIFTSQLFHTHEKLVHLGNGTEFNAASMRLDDNRDEQKKTGRVTSLNELAHKLIAALSSEICFIFLLLKVVDLYLCPHGMWAFN
jgi:hypothetical protein